METYSGTSETVIKTENCICPTYWSQEEKVAWKISERDSFSIYGSEGNFLVEGDDFFDDYFLGYREPLIFSHALNDSVYNTAYYIKNSLVAFTSLFLCDFRVSNLSWNGFNIGNSIGIIPRKSFSIRSPSLLDISTGLPYIRVDNLTFIQRAVKKFPPKTIFSFCAHLQPESLVLVKNLVKLSRIKRIASELAQHKKLSSALSFLPASILVDLDFQETKSSEKSGNVVIRFSS